MSPPQVILSRALQEKPYMVTMREGDTLRDVLRTMVDEHVHRVYIVNDEGQPTGIVTPTGRHRWDMLGVHLKRCMGAKEAVQLMCGRYKCVLASMIQCTTQICDADVLRALVSTEASAST
jgi:signal-transduction protein with cAMP-binding, CBS, and nucleotidyltransferase domain